MFMTLVTENTINKKITISELNTKQINGCTEYVEKHFQHLRKVCIISNLHSHKINQYFFQYNYEITNELKDKTNLIIVYDEMEIKNLVINNDFVILRLLQTQQLNSINGLVVIAKFLDDNYSFYLLRKVCKLH